MRYVGSHHRDHGKDDECGRDVVKQEHEHRSGRCVQIFQPQRLPLRAHLPLLRNPKDISPRNNRTPATICPCMQVQVTKMTRMAKKMTSRWYSSNANKIYLKTGKGAYRVQQGIFCFGEQIQEAVVPFAVGKLR